MPDLISRGKFESRLADTLVDVFAKYLLEIQLLLNTFDTTLGDLKNLPPDLYQRLEQDLVELLEEVLIEAYIDAFTSMDGFLADNSNTTARRGALFILNDAGDWAKIYAPKLAKQLSDVTNQKLRAIADRSPLLPLSGLGIRNVIKPVFDIGRAQLIARTEVTNAIGIAENRAINTFELADVVIEPIWYTKRDELVCIICRPRHLKPKGVNWQIPPPAHPRCRCEVKYRITYPDGRTIEVRSLEEVEAGRRPVKEIRK